MRPLVFKLKIDEVFEKKFQIATKKIKLTSLSSQSQTLKHVSASDEEVETFSKMNDSINFFKALRDAEGHFFMDWT